VSVPSRPPGPPPAGPPDDPRPAGEATAAPVGRRRAGVLAVTAGLVLAADLVSKLLVVAELMGHGSVRLLGGALYLTHARNSGAAWGFAGGATILFTAVAAAVVVVIVRTAAKLRSLPWAICLGLILGGASGNLVDRIFRAPAPFRGHVVDWISVFDPYGRVFPIFNLADSGIVCGGILAVLLALLGIEMDGTRHRGAHRDGRPDTPGEPYVPSSGPLAGPPAGPRTGPRTEPPAPRPPDEDERGRGHGRR
jgi:signal peptidase II